MKLHSLDLETNPIFNRLFPKRQLELIDKLVNKWNQPWRFYHSYHNHLVPMLDRIKKLYISDYEKQLLEIATWFHDSVYYPKAVKGLNEKNSIHSFRNSMPQELRDTYYKEMNCIVGLIESTINFRSNSKLQSWMIRLDLEYLNYAPVGRIIQNELLCLKEFQFADYSAYKQARIGILEGFMASDNPQVSRGTITNICKYLESHRPRIGIYPGSFNPFHVGHLSILKEAEKIFDKVIIAVGINPKKRQLGDALQPEKIREVLPYHQVENFPSFLHEYVEEKSKDADITVIRGFRSGYDIEEELKTLAFIRDMSKGVKVVYIPPQKKFDHISSSAVRLIKNFGEAQSVRYIPGIYYPSR